MPTPTQTIDSLAQRVKRLQELLALVQQVPPQWAEEQKKRQSRIQPMACQRWPDLLGYWHDALEMRQELVDVLTVMLAVALSTQQEGSSQLFLQVVGVPGTAKSTFCDALLVSETCYPLDHLTGFHSGSIDATGDDYSLLARINGKTLVTSEGDVIMSSPLFRQIMAQQRRIFDGTSGAVYKNRKTDMRYSGLRTPWILAGTPKIIEQDQSQLGDRFIKVRIDKPSQSMERLILRKAVRNSMTSVQRTSNCEPETQLSQEKSLAYRATGGYVDYLRENASRLIGAVDQQHHLVDRYADLGEFTAFLRTGQEVGDRWKPVSDVESAKELPTRLGEQYARLGACVAAVMQRPSVDDQVLRVIQKVAIDTSRPRLMRLVGQVYDAGYHDGVFAASLSRYNGVSDERMAETLKFMLDIGIAENFGGASADAHFRWRLSGRMRELWQVVHGLR